VTLEKTKVTSVIDLELCLQSRYTRLHNQLPLFRAHALSAHGLYAKLLYAFYHQQSFSPLFISSGAFRHSSSPTKLFSSPHLRILTLISSTSWPLRLLFHSLSLCRHFYVCFPLLLPAPLLLPTPAGARFYSPPLLSTSLVTLTSRRPTNRHGLLSTT